jgi:glycosyltransferase involved in cell wall biosynthesis
MITIVIPFYNKGESLLTTLDSLVLQTINEFEVILVDDGSEWLPDISGYNSSLFDFKVVKKSNGGVSSARNLGAELAKNQWLCFLDAGDTVSDCYVETFVKYIEGDTSSTCSLIGANFYFQNEHSLIAANEDISSDIFLSKIDYIEHLLNGKYIMVICSLAVKKSKFIEVSGFSVGSTHGEDHEFILKVVRTLDGFPYLAKKIFYYHVYGIQSATRSKAFQQLYAHAQYLLANMKELDDFEKRYLNYILADFVIVNFKKGYYLKTIQTIVNLLPKINVCGVFYQVLKRFSRYVK